MGATLPVLSKFVSKDPALIGRDVGTLYSINTFGAVFGAFASAFLLMRIFGVQTTIQIAAGFNLAIGALIFLWMKPPLRLPGAMQSTSRRLFLLIFSSTQNSACRNAA